MMPPPRGTARRAAVTQPPAPSETRSSQHTAAVHRSSPATCSQRLPVPSPRPPDTFASEHEPGAPPPAAARPRAQPATRAACCGLDAGERGAGIARPGLQGPARRPGRHAGARLTPRRLQSGPAPMLFPDASLCHFPFPPLPDQVQGPGRQGAHAGASARCALTPADNPRGEMDAEDSENHSLNLGKAGCECAGRWAQCDIPGSPHASP